MMTSMHALHCVALHCSVLQTDEWCGGRSEDESLGTLHSAVVLLHSFTTVVDCATCTWQWTSHGFGAVDGMVRSMVSCFIFSICCVGVRIFLSIDWN